MLFKNFFRSPLLLLFGLLIFGLSSCDNKPDAPVLVSLEPMRGEVKTLVVMKGENLAEIRELLFNGEPIPFNTAYNSDVALLFRIPSDMSLGQKEVEVRTDGGSFTTEFLVTEKAPVVISFTPRAANPGDRVSLIGENFFDPVEVSFKTGEGAAPGERRDSLIADIVFQSPDSLVVIVPEGARTGFIRVKANGGTRETNVTFQVFERQLISDFDGSGQVSNDDIRFPGGFNDQLAGAPFIRSTLPASLDGNFLQISGTDDLGTIWLGGAETPGGPQVDSFDIKTDVRSTFLEMDVNSNGRPDTWLLLVLKQQNGRGGDFTTRIKLNEEGWNRISIPLVRFRNSQDIVVNPQQVNQIKFHIEDRERTGRRIEANIDNVEFVERI